MKKLSTAIAVAIVLAVVIWAMSSLSTAMVRVMGFVDSFVGEETWQGESAPQEAFELTDQDYDVLDIPADAPETTRVPAAEGFETEDEADMNPSS